MGTGSVEGELDSDVLIADANKAIRVCAVERERSKAVPSNCGVVYANGCASANGNEISKINRDGGSANVSNDCCYAVVAVAQRFRISDGIRLGVAFTKEDFGISVTIEIHAWTGEDWEGKRVHDIEVGVDIHVDDLRVCVRRGKTQDGAGCCGVPQGLSSEHAHVVGLEQ